MAMLIAVLCFVLLNSVQATLLPNLFAPNLLNPNVVKCGGMALFNNSIFVNEHFPNPTDESEICKITVVKLFNVKQILLQLVKFELSDPVDGQCQTDAFRAGGVNENAFTPQLCGDNSGQHLYFPVDKTLMPFTLTVATSGLMHEKRKEKDDESKFGSGSGFGRRWMIRIIQLEDNNPLLAPEGCLQLYNGTTNRFRSFNFAPSKPGSSIELDYAVCLRREDGYCSARFTANYFNLGTAKRDPNRVTRGFNYPNYNQHYQHQYQMQYVQVTNDLLERILDKLQAKPFEKPEKLDDKLIGLFKPETAEKPKKPQNETSPMSECNGRDSLIFPPSDGQSTVCGNNFNGGRPLTVQTTAPYIVYVNIGDGSGSGFDISYDQMICPHRVNE